MPYEALYEYGVDPLEWAVQLVGGALVCNKSFIIFYYKKVSLCLLQRNPDLASVVIGSEEDRENGVLSALEMSAERKSLNVLGHFAQTVGRGDLRHALDACAVHGYGEGIGVILAEMERRRWPEEERKGAANRAANMAAQG